MVSPTRLSFCFSIPPPHLLGSPSCNQHRTNNRPPSPVHSAPAVLVSRFALDHEQVKHTNSGVKRSRASLGEDGDLDEVVIVTTMLRPGGSSVIVVEARKLLNRGQIHQQVRGLWTFPAPQKKLRSQTSNGTHDATIR